MNRLQPHELAKFLRSYRFVGGKLRAVKVVHSGARVVGVEFRVRVREAINLCLNREAIAQRIRRVGEGPSEVHRWFIARDLLKNGMPAEWV